MRAKFIYEKFTEDSDPVNDMGIGLKHLIEKWIEEMNKKSIDQMGIKNYSIDEYANINVEDNCSLPDHCGNIPEYIKFGIIKGEFIISNCNMTTLRGCPEIVERDFKCNSNSLTSLEYCPKIVKGNFICSGNVIGFNSNAIRKICKVGKDIIN